MGMIPNSHITIYNKYIDPDARTEKWQRAEVYSVVWQAQHAVANMKEMVAANTALILIPFSSGTEYMQPKSWQANRSTGWTLQEGDVVVRGLIDDEITDDFTITDLRATYDEVVTIASIDAMDQGYFTMHWELRCK
jgi:hypothetical protein